MKLTDRLVADWRNAWRWWSVRCAVAFGALVWIVLASPDILLGVLNALPPEMRSVFPPAFSISLTALITALRLWKQRPKHETPPDESHGA